MSDSRDAKNERQLQQRIETFNSNGYGQLSADTVYALAINNPAGFGDMATTATGSILTTGQVQQAFSTFKAGKYDDAAESLTFDQWVNDPRAPVRLEAGQYVYRPERMAGNDFVSKDQESLIESLAAFPFVLSAFAAPFAASISAASAASSGLGGASLAAEEFFAGMNSLVPGGSGVAEAIAAAGAGASTLTVPAGAGELLNTLKPVGTVAGAVGSVAGAVGSVASATGAVVQTNRLLDSQGGLATQASSPNVFVNPLSAGANDMATKAASTASAPASSPINMQNLLTLAVVAVLAFAVLSELKD